MATLSSQLEGTQEMDGQCRAFSHEYLYRLKNQIGSSGPETVTLKTSELALGASEL